MSEAAVEAKAPATKSAPTRGEPVLEMRNVHRYFGRLKAVNDVSFKAYRGQVMGFIGPNGAGKTTAMRILSTLDRPTAGDAFVGGFAAALDADGEMKDCLAWGAVTGGLACRKLGAQTSLPARAEILAALEGYRP